ncbi:MAG: polysaccharide biosynthesis C-terminal domain-containing protein [Sarcina sp.]
MKEKSYSSNMKYNLITQAIKIFIAGVNTILFAKVLGAENRGIYSYIVLIIGLCYDYGNFGINIVSSIYLKDNKFRKNEVYNTNLKFLILSSGIISIILIALRVSNIFLVTYPTWTVVIGAGLIVVTMLSYYMINCYIAEEKLYYVNRFMIAQAVIEFSINIILIFLGKFDVQNILLNRFITYLVMLIVITYKLKIMTSIEYKLRNIFKINILQAEFSNSLAAYFAAILVYLNYRVDQFMIKPELGLEQLGVYTLGVSLAEMVFLIPNSIGSAFLGRLMNCNDEEKEKTINATVKLSFYLSLFIVVGGIVVSPLIPFVYGKEFAQSVSVTIILLLGTVMASFGKILSNVYMSRGQMRVELKYGFISFVINLILNFVMIPTMGIVGSAIASTISYVIYGLMYLLRYSRETGKNPFYVIKIHKSEIEMLKAKLKRK